MITTKIITVIDKAVQALHDGEVIGMPTETVYGLAGAINLPDAIEKIYRVKERPLSNPLIVHIPDISRLDSIACAIPEAAYKLAEAFWPGPLTLVLKKNPEISDLVTSGMDSVAVRIPQHPVALSLLEAVNMPLAAPSANPFGRVSPVTANHVFNYFNGIIPYIVDGGTCKVGIESTIVGFDNGEPVLYRYGTITPEAIEKIAGSVKVQVHTKELPKAPGMLLRHYSPETPMVFTDDIEKALAQHYGKKIGLIRLREGELPYNVSSAIALLKAGNIEAAAAGLYSALHKMDNKRLDVIIAEKFPAGGIGTAINDKLFRASQQLHREETI